MEGRMKLLCETYWDVGAVKTISCEALLHFNLNAASTILRQTTGGNKW